MATEPDNLYSNILTEIYNYSLGDQPSNEKQHILVLSYGLAQNVTFKDQLFLKEVIEPAIEQHGVDAIRKVFNEPPAFSRPLLAFLTEYGAPLAVTFAVKEIGADVNVQGTIYNDSGAYLKSSPPICYAQNDKGGDGMVALLIELGANLDLPYAYKHELCFGSRENPSIRHSTVREALQDSMKSRIGMPLAMIGKFSAAKPQVAS